MTSHRRIIIVVFPGQGHINPSLQFAKRLVCMGVDVTLSTSITIVRRIEKQTTIHGLTFAPISDDEEKPATVEQFVSDFATNGSLAGNPFDHLVYTTIVPWAAAVAKSHCIKSTLLWCQSATILGLYYYYFNGYQDVISSGNDNTSVLINLPGNRTHQSTFYELEIEPIRALDKFEMLPLIPSAFLDGRDPCGDFFEKTEEDYIKWLNTKPSSSVVYVSFGSMATLSADQAEEMANGLLESRRPFLWVIRDSEQARRLSKIEELKKQGMIVSWCSQVEVLSHQAIGCFMTHCELEFDSGGIGGWCSYSGICAVVGSSD